MWKRNYPRGLFLEELAVIAVAAYAGRTRPPQEQLLPHDKLRSMAADIAAQLPSLLGRSAVTAPGTIGLCRLVVAPTSRGRRHPDRSLLRRELVSDKGRDHSVPQGEGRSQTK